ncbi:MAG: hypothetical protein WC941_05670 [Candidatus Bathyarchaeia archaeon]
MKTLIVYYSRDGSTRKVAEELKAQLGADIEEITEPKGRGGPLGWIRSGKEASSGAIVPINPEGRPLDLRCGLGRRLRSRSICACVHPVQRTSILLLLCDMA